MPHAKILIVEDDAIISRHIQAILNKNGYQICGIVPSGSEAVRIAGEETPELIIMDIQLEGTMDGVEAAQKIQSAQDIPIIYLTAFADRQTLQRAKITDPFGYVLKPFEERTLVTNIEMALNKHSLEKRLRESEELFRTLVENQGEGLGIVDPEGFFIFANPAMETIIGVTQGELVGQSFYQFIAPEFQDKERSEAQKSRSGQKSVYELDIIRPDGERRCISINATPWSKDGIYSGIFGISQDVTERKRVETAEKEQRALAEALRDSAAVLNSTLALDEVLDRILSNVGRVVPHDGANIMLLEGNEVHVARGIGKFSMQWDQIIDRPVSLEKYPIFHSIINSGEPLVVANPEKFGLDKLSPQMEWIQSYLLAPIKIKGKMVGFLNLGSRTPAFFNKNHSERLQAFINQAALAIENARLFEDSQKRAQYLALLIQVTQAAINSTDLDVTLTEIARVLTDIYHSDGVYITLWDESRRLTIPTAAYGHTAEVYKTIRQEPGDLTMTASALKEGRPLVAVDVEASEWIDSKLAATFPVRSLLAIPLIAGEQKLGAILVGFIKEHVFSAEEIAQGEEIASQVALAITKLRLYAEIQRLSITDDLTLLAQKMLDYCRHEESPVSRNNVAKSERKFHFK